MTFSPARIHRLADTLERVAAAIERGTAAKAWAGKAPAKAAPQPCRDPEGQFASCGTGGGGHGHKRTPEQRGRARERFHKKLRKEFPFLKDKDIGHLTVAPGDRVSSEHLAPNQITRHEEDIVLGRLDNPDNPVRKPREVKAHSTETTTWSLSATVSTNPMYGIMADSKKYKVEFSSVGPHYQGHDFVDHFNSRRKALAVAKKGHAGQIEEYVPRLARKGKPTAKELFRAAGTTRARVDRLIYRHDTPWHDVPRDMRVAWLAHEREEIKDAPKSFGEGEIRKGPHGAPMAWFDVSTRIAGKVKWGEWTEADERATFADHGHGHEPAAKSLSVDDRDTPDPDAPTYATILDAALDATGLRGPWEAGTLEGRAALDLLHAVRLEGRRHLRAMAEALLAEVAPDGEKALAGGVRQAVKGFFGRAGKYVRELFAAGVLAIAGPDPAVLDMPVVRDALNEQVAVQMAYLDDFQHRVVSEAKPLGPMVVANAEQYGAAVYGAAIEVQRQEIVAAAKAKEEKRNLEACQHCTDCPEISAKGWQPIGTLPPIGFKDHKGTPTECRIYCRCWFSYR